MTIKEQTRRKAIITKHFQQSTLNPTPTCIEIYLEMATRKFNKIFAARPQTKKMGEPSTFRDDPNPENGRALHTKGAKP